MKDLSKHKDYQNFDKMRKKSLIDILQKLSRRV